MQSQIYRTNEVLRLTGLSRSTLWRMERDGRFPRKLRLGPNSVGWLASDIDEWINDLRNESTSRR